MFLGIRVWTVLVALVICSSCGGGNPFVPAVGPFTGELMVGDAVIGGFTLTTTNGLLGGTGTLTHNDQPVNITISATVDNQHISGTISNASLGAGNFMGDFSDVNTLGGQFNYQDIGQISITTGTWTASALAGSSD